MSDREASYIVRNVRQPCRSAFSRGIGDFELQYGPLRTRIPCKMDRISVIGPRTRRQRNGSGMGGGVQGTKRAGESKSATAVLTHIFRVVVIDPGVWRHTGQRRLRIVATPIKPPKIHAILLQILMKIEICRQLAWYAPIENETASAIVVAFVLRQIVLSRLLRLCEFRILGADAWMDIKRCVQSLGMGPLQVSSGIWEVSTIELPAIPARWRLPIRIGH